MKRTALILTLFLAAFSLQAISPYLLVADVDGSLSSVETKVEEALSSRGFSLLGKYNPSSKTDKLVIVYSNKQLQNICGRIEDRGMLAAALKIGIWERQGKIRVTMLNPEYLFYVYLRGEADKGAVKAALEQINKSARDAMSTIGSTMKPFGGDLDKKKLKEYKYMMGMPKFDAPVELKEFNSFSDGLLKIQANLNRKKGSTLKVYEIIDSDKEIAVFGVGLMDPEKGEAHFLPIIGEKHIAAMPYEIILQGNKATMLHGRFRFASHWPELTMGTFTKIMSSPGDAEEFMRGLTE